MNVDTAIPNDAAVDTRDVAADAEAAGFTGLWAGEVRHDPFLALGVAALGTHRIELGTSIALAFARNPMSTAIQANDLQLLSGGRLLLGLGSQIKPHITRRFSMPWSHPAPRMREYILAMRAIWDCWHNGTRLDFQGQFYTHTLMTPFFDPGPNPHGPPRVFMAGVGDMMTSVAGEVADGFLCHAFSTARYIREATVPALQRGRAGACGDLTGFELSGAPFVATGRTEEELAAACTGVREQLAFYGSTPAYRAVLKLHGWSELADELHRLSREGRWPDMPSLIDDEVLQAFAVVAEPDRVAAELARRFGGVLTRMTLCTPYDIDPTVKAQIAADVRAIKPHGSSEDRDA